MATRSFLSRFRLDWPLLGKELQETAARKQTYIMRVCYAVLLFGAFSLFYVRQIGDGTVLRLGGGLGPFRFIVVAQFIAIFLFLPPLMAGAVAREKERDTLGLLFLTDLTPWELILQKYIGHLIPMLTLLLLSMPLMAVAYSLGGVPAYLLWGSILMLLLVCLTVGAIALESSVHQATTFQALLRSWGICIGFGIFCLAGPPLLLTSASSAAFEMVILLIMLALPSMAPMFVFLFLAKHNLESRAFVRPRNPLGTEFKRLDQYWKDARKILRAVFRDRDHEAFSGAREVVRRQTASDAWNISPGAFFLTRMHLPPILSASIIGATLLILFLVSSVVLSANSTGFRVAIGAFWLLALMTIPILSANAISRERISDRLAPVLTTPLSAQEILENWISPLRRWIRFIISPLVVLIALDAFVKSRSSDATWPNVVAGMAISLLAAVIYPWLVRWTSVWIGLRIANQLRALMSALLLTAAWCFAPGKLAEYLFKTGLLSEQAASLLTLLSPVTVIGSGLSAGLDGGDISHQVVWAATHLALAASLAVGIRQVCLKNADHHLGRL